MISLVSGQDELTIRLTVDLALDIQETRFHKSLPRVP